MIYSCVPVKKKIHTLYNALVWYIQNHHYPLFKSKSNLPNPHNATETNPSPLSNKQHQINHNCNCKKKRKLQTTVACASVGNFEWVQVGSCERLFWVAWTPSPTPERDPQACLFKFRGLRYYEGGGLILGYIVFFKGLRCCAYVWAFFFFGLTA